jgi:hypothetical protein
MSDSPTLDYAAPQVFFQGEFRSRTFGTMLSSLAFFAVAIVVYRADRPPLPASVNDLKWAWAFIGFFLAIGSAGLWQWWRAEVTPVRVTSDGVEAGGKAWRWSAIEEISGTEENHQILLYVRVGGFPPRRLLRTTPLLGKNQFERLRRTLHQFFRDNGIPVLTSDYERESN